MTIRPVSAHTPWAGAQFGYQLLWLAPLCVPLMIAVQEMCGRVALVTSKGLTAVIKDHYSKWILYGVLVLLVGANTINVYADINIMAASMKMLFGWPFAPVGDAAYARHGAGSDCHPV